ncbi:unnamed protein product [Vitrella brassicaformis CCMP3155]|uniref:Uncharacterized protein n=1 Tax=Vitrella brassicaformis (strain CCMP3155) TaxID=1169540 RepID=A0A0G4EDZ1_VITBC|nr:unnamed protein product [Vitrella brassicaformis CCMP3155]|mmetsp:Transcript_39011/g.111485  ORF Transcript_39011/g.111485 Transcript_39011/m.111485 type:complete len:432 (+) Transcript_39011:442-1737(+)|eukprot:CEL93969.1 unnamed protein product [Vitrella brassicaformis CCMP3155]
MRCPLTVRLVQLVEGTRDTLEELVGETLDSCEVDLRSPSSDDGMLFPQLRTVKVTGAWGEVAFDRDWRLGSLEVFHGRQRHHLYVFAFLHSTSWDSPMGAWVAYSTDLHTVTIERPLPRHMWLFADPADAVIRESLRENPALKRLTGVEMPMYLGEDEEVEPLPQLLELRGTIVGPKLCFDAKFQGFHNSRTRILAPGAIEDYSGSDFTFPFALLWRIIDERGHVDECATTAILVASYATEVSFPSGLRDHQVCSVGFYSLVARLSFPRATKLTEGSDELLPVPDMLLDCMGRLFPSVTTLDLSEGEELGETVVHAAMGQLTQLQTITYYVDTHEDGFCPAFLRGNRGKGPSIHVSLDRLDSEELPLTTLTICREGEEREGSVDDPITRITATVTADHTNDFSVECAVLSIGQAVAWLPNLSQIVLGVPLW